MLSGGSVSHQNLWWGRVEKVRRGHFSSGGRGKAILEGAGQRGVSHQVFSLGGV